MNQRVEYLDGRGVIVTTPAGFRASAVWCLIVGEGRQPRPGTGRFAVNLARRLAECGFPSVRFDLPGTGERVADGCPHRPYGDGPVEVRSIMNSLIYRGLAKEFFLVGKCSGADGAFLSAADVECVRGLFLINGCFWYGATAHSLFPSSKAVILNRLLKRQILSPGAWLHWLRKVRGGVLCDIKEKFLAAKPSREIISAEQRLAFRSKWERIAHGVSHIHLVFAEGSPYYAMFAMYTLPELHSLKISDKIDYSVLDAADHVVTPVVKQEWLLEAIMRWTQKWQDNDGDPKVQAHV